MSITRFAAVAAFAAGVAFAGSASAQVRTWNFGDTTTPGACTGTYSTMGNTIGCSQQPAGATTTLNVTAWSTTGSGGTYAAAAVNQQGTASGFGVYNTVEGTSASSPDHSMDNSGTGIDALLLNFTGGLSAQILKTVTLGWSGADGDFQVLRWGGVGAVTSITGKSTAQLITDGWVLTSTVDGAGNISTPDVAYGVNGGNLASSSWLITAFNSAFGGGGTTGIDAIKVLGVTTGLAVPAPGTLALAALALVGMGVVRRRKQQA